MALVGIGLLIPFPSHAQTQYCDADMTPPLSGYQSKGSALNIDVRPGDSSTDYNDLLALWESRTIARNLYYGWTSFDLVRGQGFPNINPQKWTWSGFHPSYNPPNRSGNANAYYDSNVQLCPTGYERQYGYYNGQHNTWYCTLSNPNLRTCDTAQKPDKERGCGTEGTAFEGNPCNVATGNKYQKETDFEGSGPFPLEFARFYNSDESTPSSTLGPQWRHTYDRKIVFSWDRDLALIHTGPIMAYVYRPNGQVVAFEVDSATGAVLPRDPDTNTSLSKVGSSWEYRTEDDLVETYELVIGPGSLDPHGQLIALRALGGQELAVSYQNDRVHKVTDDYGREIVFGYDGQGRLTSVTDPNASVYNYTYDSSGLLASVKYPDETPLVSTDNPLREYRYEDASHLGALTSLVNENGDIHGEWAYDSSRRAVSSQRAGGKARLDFTYNTSDTTVVAAGGETRVYSFSLIQNARRVTGISSGGVSETVAYDSNGRPQTKTDRNGIQSTHVFDARGLETTRVEASGTAMARTVTTQWHAQFRLPTQTTVGSLATTYQYSASGLLSSITQTDTSDSSSRTTTLGYNVDGLLTSIDGPRTDLADVSTFTYDLDGNRSTFTNAAGHVTAFDLYDDVGRLLKMTDPNNLVTEFEYDPRGRLVKITETPPVGGLRVTDYSYDALGQLSEVTLPNGRELTLNYSEARYLTSIEDNLGNRVEYAQDAQGNTVQTDIRDPGASLRRNIAMTFDARNRVATINAAGSITNFTYDNEENVATIQDPNGNTTTYSYDPLYRLEAVVDALTGSAALTYDVHDMLSSVTSQAGAITLYDYDELGNLDSTTSPDTGTSSLTQDSAGNIVAKTDGKGVTSSFTYDALNRVTSISYPDTTLNVTFTYDGGTNQKGRLTAMTDASGSSTFSYDVYGNLTQEAKTVGSNTHTTSYTYDAANLLTQITYPSGRVVDYTRNVLGQVTQVATTYNSVTQTVASSVGYEPFGPLNALTFGNGLVLTRTFDQQYRLTDQVTAGGGVTAQDLTFTLDAASNIDAIADAVDTTLNQTFAQDVLHRITQDVGSYGTKDFTYDGVGNRLTQVFNDGSTTVTQTLTYTANSNKLATHDGNAVTIDSAGNTTADTVQSLAFTYGDHNRMATASVGGVQQASYTYNGQGQRITKVESTGSLRTFVFHYGLNGELIGESVYDSFGNLVEERDYLWLDSLPLAQSERAFSGSTITSSSFVYIHGDQLNTPRLATDSTKTTVWRWDSDAFGEGQADMDPDADLTLVNIRLRFPGQYLDEETNLHYNYFRDYDPVLGRYVESDPIGLSGGINTYGYGMQNALTKKDQYGLATWTLKGATNASLAFGVGATASFLTLESECQDGKVYIVDVTAVGPSAGVGLKCRTCFSAPFNQVFGGTIFEDPFPTAHPSALNGAFLSVSAGAQLMGFGGEYGQIVLGNAVSPLSYSPSIGFGNIGLNVTGTIGTSTVTDVRTRDCACE